MSSQGTPDLASVLQTLASLAPAQQQAVSGALFANPASASTFRSSDPARQGYSQESSQSYSQPREQLQTAHRDPRREAWSASPHLPASSPPAPRESINPATIIDWSTGLRCVMKTVAQNEQILQQIRQMMKSQHDHEKQWWSGRVSLLEKQAARVEGQKKLEEMLRAVGSTAPSGSSRTSPDELAEELKTYDMKVHRAQMHMIEEMSKRLRSMGVPFFGVPESMIIKQSKKDESRTVSALGDTNRSKNTITEEDLAKLQKKMLDILEDLCRDGTEAT